jgi:hypothetical protein
MKIVKHARAAALLLALTTGVVACNSNNPSYTGNPDVAVSPPEKPAPKEFEKSFKFSTSETTLAQDKFDKNTVSVRFQALDSSGASINNLKAKDVKVEENGVNVTPFKLSTDETDRSQHTVDIQFVVDTTKSMIPRIESAVRRVISFVKSSRQRGYHTRMCFSTFGDTIKKKCERFYDNNPNDKSTQAQVDELVSDLASIKALPKSDDPANTDLPENPMRALIEAAKAPWAPDAQRFVILITDADFLYAPDNMGAMYKAGKLPPDQLPPNMEETIKAIQGAQMTVYAVTPPNVPGYVGDFQGQKSIVEASHGKFFEFKKVMTGTTSLDAVLEDIILTVKTTYKVEYVVDDVQGLNPTLKVEDRHVAIKLNGGTSNLISTLSSMPTGRAEYKQTFKIADQEVYADSLQVFVNDKKLGAGEYSLNKTDVTLKSVPAAGANLRFVFYYQELGKNLRLEQILVNGDGDPRDTRVWLNDIEARADDYTIEKDEQGNAVVHLKEASVLANNDPYGIRKNAGVHVKVVTNYLR